jgi:tetratricopeptide (TPR) repeat protein
VIALAAVGALILVGAGIAAAVYFMRPRPEPQRIAKEEPKAPKDPAADERLKKSEEENKRLEQKLAALEEEKKKEEFKRHMDRGNEAYEAKRYDEAVAAYADALKLYDDADAKNALIKAQSSAVAATKLEEDRKKQREDYNRLMADGAKFVEAKAYAKAFEAFQAALIVVPNDGAAAKALKEVEGFLSEEEKQRQKLALFDFHMKNANAAMVRQDYATALQAFNVALTIVPDNPDAKKGMQAAQDRLAAAQAQATRTAQAQAEIAKGRDALRERRFDDAVAAFQKALQLMPDDRDATKGLADATALRNKAKVDYAQLMTQGDTLMQAQRFAEALASYHAALQAVPNDPKAQAGVLAANQGLAAAAAAAQNAPAMLQAYLAQGQAALAFGRLTDAANAFRAALAISPNYPIALAGLAEVQRLVERRAARLVEITNLFKIGDQALQARQFSTAIKAYKDILQLDPDNLKAIENLREARYQKAMAEGQQLLLAKKFAEAARHFEEALREKPGDFLATNFLKQAQTGKPK